MKKVDMILKVVDEKGYLKVYIPKSVSEYLGLQKGNFVSVTLSKTRKKKRYFSW